jgi:hypothetical protein
MVDCVTSTFFYLMLQFVLNSWIIREIGEKSSSQKNCEYYEKGRQYVVFIESDQMNSMYIIHVDFPKNHIFSIDCMTTTKMSCYSSVFRKKMEI